MSRPAASPYTVKRFLFSFSMGRVTTNTHRRFGHKMSLADEPIDMGAMRHVYRTIGAVVDEGACHVHEIDTPCRRGCAHATFGSEPADHVCNPSCIHASGCTTTHSDRLSYMGVSSARRTPSGVARCVTGCKFVDLTGVPGCAGLFVCVGSGQIHSCPLVTDPDGNTDCPHQLHNGRGGGGDGCVWCWQSGVVRRRAIVDHQMSLLDPCVTYEDVFNATRERLKKAAADAAAAPPPAGEQLGTAPVGTALRAGAAGTPSRTGATADLTQLVRRCVRRTARAGTVSLAETLQSMAPPAMPACLAGMDIATHSRYRVSVEIGLARVAAREARLEEARTIISRLCRGEHRHGADIYAAEELLSKVNASLRASPTAHTLWTVTLAVLCADEHSVMTAGPLRVGRASNASPIVPQRHVDDAFVARYAERSLDAFNYLVNHVDMSNKTYMFHHHVVVYLYMHASGCGGPGDAWYVPPDMALFRTLPTERLRPRCISTWRDPPLANRFVQRSLTAADGFLKVALRQLTANGLISGMLY